MGELIFAILAGILLIGLGLLNIEGNISTIHWYHRTRIREEDKSTYGKWVGSGTIVIGAGVALAASCQLLTGQEWAAYLTLPALFIGMILILYAQFKYNGGLF